MKPKLRRCTSRGLSNAFKICSTRPLTRGTGATWCGEEAWEGLLAYLASDEFKGKFARNKTNRTSRRGGAVHTTGLKTHIEVAFDMARELGRVIDPHEFFVATHIKRDGGWVDDCVRSTYTNYQDRLREVESQMGDNSI